MVSGEVAARGYLGHDLREQAIETAAAEVVREGRREDEVAGGQPVDVEGGGGRAEVEDHVVDGVALAHNVDEVPQPIPYHRGERVDLGVRVVFFEHHDLGRAEFGLALCQSL